MKTEIFNVSLTLHYIHGFWVAAPQIHRDILNLTNGLVVNSTGFSRGHFLCPGHLEFSKLNHLQGLRVSPTFQHLS